MSTARSSGRYLGIRKWVYPAYRLVPAEPGQRHLQPRRADGPADKERIEPVNAGPLHREEEPGRIAVL